MFWVRRGALLPQEHDHQERQASERLPAGDWCTHARTPHLRTHAPTHARILTRTHPTPHLVIGALEVRWPSQGLPAFVVAAAAEAQQEWLCKEAVETDRCLVCLGPPHEPMRLPRQLVLHGVRGGAAGEGRVAGVPAVPPGPEKLFELGWRVWVKVQAAASGTNTEWPLLSSSQQDDPKKLRWLLSDLLFFELAILLFKFYRQIASPQRHHSVTTASPQRHHSVTTASPHRHHTVTTPSPQRTAVTPR